MNRMGHSTHTTATLALALAVLIFAGPTGSAVANCESGAYMIHTVAEYAESEDIKASFLRIESADSTGFRLVSVAQGGLPRLEEARGPVQEPGENPPLTVVTEYQRCLSASARFEEDPIGRLGLRIEGCADLVQPNGYVVYDAQRRELRIPRPLSIQRGTSPQGAVAIEGEIQSAIAGLDLVAAAGLDLHPERVTSPERIQTADIESILFEHTQVGAPGRGALLSVAVLRLRNLDRLLPIRGDPDPESVRGRLADFPVLFLSQSGGPSRYIGDGSACAGLRLHLPSADAFLGALDRFVISGAWDLDVNGTPDLIQVNDRVLYWIQPDGPLLVLDYRQGC